MGCVKSKRGEATENAESARASPVHLEAGPGESSARIDPVLLDYAQRLSEEIMARAVRRWAELDGRYGDIPYIECDVP